MNGCVCQNNRANMNQGLTQGLTQGGLTQGMLTQALRMNHSNPSSSTNSPRHRNTTNEDAKKRHSLVMDRTSSLVLPSTGVDKRSSLVFPPGLEFNYESMEDELTCPVCLELYADPLMLPCSHSVCKKCLEDIYDSRAARLRNADGVECPSCRKKVGLPRNKVHTLPRNLALENVVIRYTEERSKSIRKSLSLESPVSDLLLSPVSDASDVPEFPGSSRAVCELCEGHNLQKAAWFCLQCEVAYCHTCFAKFHPRRGALARHKVRQPADEDEHLRPLHCVDHETEVASIFCDKCKVLICTLCVCDGEGKHSGHKVLALDTACRKIKESVDSVRTKTDGLLTTLTEHKMKIEALTEAFKEQQQESRDSLEVQYSRVVHDLTAALQQERTGVLQVLDNTGLGFVKLIQLYTEKSEGCCGQLRDLSQACEEVGTQGVAHSILHQASSIVPLNERLQQAKTLVEGLSSQYESIIKEKKSTSLELQSGVENFRKGACSTIAAMSGEVVDQTLFIVPHIKCPTSPGREELATPRIHNKYLITWGFSSTSFTGEQLEGSAGWTITLEKNSSHWGHLNTGYLFGVGISCQTLTVKDLVGVTDYSHGVICNAGMLYYSHNNTQEPLLTLTSLPISITISVTLDNPDHVLLIYKLTPSDQSTALVGKRLIKDPRFRENVFPVFTVSQRVKLLFPTFV